MDKVAGDVRHMVNDDRAIKLLSNNADYKVYMTYHFFFLKNLMRFIVCPMPKAIIRNPILP